jgi:hypothetical protein
MGNISDKICRKNKKNTLITSISFLENRGFYGTMLKNMAVLPGHR